MLRLNLTRILRNLTLVLIAVLPLAGYAQQNEAQHKFLDWKNITIMSTAAGGHVWAAKEYNGPGYTNTEVMELTYQQEFSFHPSYSYAKEFSQMGMATALAYVFHRTNHHKLERWFLAGDSFVAYGSGWIYTRQYHHIDCQIGSVVCNH